MEDDVDQRSMGRTKLGRKSWVAYIQPVFGCLVILGAMIYFHRYWPTLSVHLASISADTIGFHDRIYMIVEILLTVLLLVPVYKIAALRSYCLYYDDSGVWLSSGVFPWDRGRVGVKWRDLDEAAFVPTFLNWIFRAHTVIIRHRFTKDGEIMVDKIHRGKRAVSVINGLMQDLVQKNNNKLQ